MSYLFLGKEKLLCFLREEGFTVSASTVERIIKYLKLFVLLPHSPKSDGMMERLNHTFWEKVWNYYDDEIELETMQFHLKRWTNEVYNKKGHAGVWKEEPGDI